VKTSGGELLRVIPATRDDAGTPLEPEERPATEAFSMPVEVNISSEAVAPGSGAAAGRLRGMVGVDTTAGEVAQAAATRCELCEHWRRDAYLKHLAAIADTIAGQKQLDAMRGELLGRKSGSLSVTTEDLLSVNASIQYDFGICAAFTESERIPVAAAFYGGCPENDQRFKSRSRSDQRAGSAAFDAVMRLAQGRKE